MANSKISALTSATTPLAGTETLPVVQSSATTKVTVANLTAGRDVATKSITTTLGNVSINAASSGTPLDVRSNSSATTGVQTVAAFLGITSGSTDSAYATAIVPYTKNANGNYWPAAFGAANSAYGSNYADATIYWGNTGTVLVEGIRLQAVSGDVQVKTGNIVPNTAAKGINFTANTSAAGMTSKLLNDYEEGTWTPSGLLSSPGTSSTSNVVATYTKVGRLVNVVCSFTFTLGTGSGFFSIRGLPFTANSALVYTALAQGCEGVGALTKNIVGYINPSNTNFYLLFQPQSTSALAQVTSGEMAAASTIRISASYAT